VSDGENMSMEVLKAQIEQLKTEQVGHHTRIRALEQHRNSTPDAAKQRLIEHVIDELPPTDSIKKAVAHTETSERAWNRFIGGILDHISKIAIAVVLVGLAAWFGGIKIQ